MKLIDKEALVAEIKKLENESKIYPSDFDCGRLSICKELINFLDTLGVKEVDLGKEFYDFLDTFIGIDLGHLSEDGLFGIAKHFFELGLKAQKIQDEIKIGETEIYLEDDGGEPPYDGIQWLDLSCMEYEIPKDKFKDGDNVEIIICKK